MKDYTKQLLIEMFVKWAGEEARSFVMLPPSGSYREYYRITGSTRSAIGCYNADLKENNAFLAFTDYFHAKGLSVPEIYDRNDENYIYLHQDLGDVSLYSFIQALRLGEEFPDELLGFYKKTIDGLIKFQFNSNELDYNQCYPRKAFDKQSMLWDLNYFKYYFLKLAKVPFDEQLLEDDYNTFIDFLLEADCDYFMYRDFQSRNIMVYREEPWFIDYQGGRKGALQYDLASLLYDAKADIPEEKRDEILDYYISQLSSFKTIDQDQFKQHYYGYVLIRIMQAMGAYGFRGFYEKKEHFLKSIPYAINNLKGLLKKVSLPVEIPTLLMALQNVAESEELMNIGNESNELIVTINSFSYKRGIPVDFSGNGGGHVFDCRAVHNPGRYAEYKDKTGMDEEVIEFFNNEPEMDRFLSGVFPIVEQSVEKYLTRGFKHLMVSFGCTGGQHRSVYSAEKLAKYLKEKYNLSIKLAHVEQEMKRR